MEIWSKSLALTVGTTALLLTAFTAGRASESVSFDASWWRNLEPLQQFAAIQGAIDGYKAGYAQGSRDTGTANIIYAFDRDEKVAVRLNGSHAYWAAVLHVNATDPAPANPPTPIFTDTFGTYRDGVTHFYENRPSKNDMTLGSVMACLSSAPPKDGCSE